MSQKKEAQVIAAGISYFSRENVLDANGEVSKDQQGNDVAVTLRHEALYGETVELTQHEFDRLAALDAVREPSDAPLRPPPRATPFGVPMPIGDSGEVGMFPGPVMGDPRAAGAGTDPTGLDRVGPGAKALTADELVELERRARGEQPGAESIDVDGLSSDEVKDHIEENHLAVEDTVALAKGSDGEIDPVKAELVLEAETARDRPRKGVVDALTAALEEDDEEE